MPTSLKDLPLFTPDGTFPKVPASGVLPIVVNGITRKTFVSNATNLCGGGTVTGLTGGQNISISTSSPSINQRKLVINFTFPGIIVPYVMNAEQPAGWLYCNGQEVSRAEYANLFAVVSTTYGSGNGTTTFNVPDLRGRIPFGTSATTSNPLNGAIFASGNSITVASTGGSENTVLNTAHAPIREHSHTSSGSMVVYGNTERSDADGGCSPPGNFGDYGAPGAIGGPGTTYPLSKSNVPTSVPVYPTEPLASVLPHNNMPPCIFLTYLIKT
jgi:microcystin-dependent protein